MNNASQDGRAARKCTVLVVDDDEVVCRNTEAMLKSLGYSALTVSSGLSAIGQVTAWHPDIILTDIFMPQFDGIELISALRAGGSAVPIVAMTGGPHGAFDVLTAAKDLGATAVLHKPFSPDDLSAVLGAALQSRH